MSEKPVESEAVDVVERANAYVARWNSPSDPDTSPYGVLMRELLAEVARLKEVAEAAEGVVWFDYSLDDRDVEQAVDRLRAALARLSAPKR
jgi:hypothetical protein